MNKEKYYLVVYTYSTDGEEFIYRRPFKTDVKWGKALADYIKVMLAEWEEPKGNWMNNQLVLSSGTILTIDQWFEIPKEDYDVLVKYI